MKGTRIDKLDSKILSKVPEETAHIFSLVTTSAITEVDFVHHPGKPTVPVVEGCLTSTVCCLQTTVYIKPSVPS